MKEYKELNYFRCGTCDFRLLLDEEDGTIKLEVYNETTDTYDHLCWFNSPYEGFILMKVLRMTNNI